LLCAGESQSDATAKVVLSFAGRKLQSDSKTVRETKEPCVISHNGNRIAIYGDNITFQGRGNVLVIREDSQECVGYLDCANDQVLARIGYDLFSEVRRLLTVGQPPANALMPTLELHIAFLRDLVTSCGVSLAEIPPAPEGYAFVACLTHDVDHPSIRQHKLDHTIFGFLYRAVVGSLLNFFRGRMSAQDLLRNWAAVAKLPMVYLGITKDFWREFDTSYLELEKGLHSTFFVIPFKDRPGRCSSGPAPKHRAARYGAQDISGAIQKVATAGCEVGLHGIDAWLDNSKGREEAEEIRNITAASEIGVRMHWLYYDQQSPLILESAGLAYDSTIGYNGTVGYRAGTTQVFKPLKVKQLLELPLHIMDTALFYPSHLGLSVEQAKVLIDQILGNAVSFGGALTINWHDRSIAPERLWDSCYRELLVDLKRRGAWFATAGQAVSWFRKRRSATFESDSIDQSVVRVKVASVQEGGLPGLRLRIHTARKPDLMNAPHGSQEFVDMSPDECVDTTFEAGR
jgi:peptidoglycan/xylan/chitin deacetylase (PgdA/CDA1 family)